jgi:hypothetical protein
MSVLITLVGVWLALNAALFAALWSRRSNPKPRAGLSAAPRGGDCTAFTTTAFEHKRRRRQLTLIDGK